MNAKKFILAGISAFVVMFLLSGIFHQVLAGDFYRSLPFGTDEPNMAYLAVAYVLITLIMTYMYPKGVEESGSKITQGLKFGALMGLMYAGPMNFILLAISPETPSIYPFVECGWHMVEQGIGGIVLAYVYKLPA